MARQRRSGGRESATQVFPALLPRQLRLRLGGSRPDHEIGPAGKSHAVGQPGGQDPGLIKAPFPQTGCVQRHRNDRVHGPEIGLLPGGPRHRIGQKTAEGDTALIFEGRDQLFNGAFIEEGTDGLIKCRRMEPAINAQVCSGPLLGQREPAPAAPGGPGNRKQGEAIPAEGFLLQGFQRAAASRAGRREEQGTDSPRQWGEHGSMLAHRSAACHEDSPSRPRAGPGFAGRLGRPTVAAGLNARPRSSATELWRTPWPLGLRDACSTPAPPGRSVCRDAGLRDFVAGPSTS